MTDAAVAGYDVLIKACKAPVAQIVENTGEVPEIVLRKLLKTAKENYGYDAKTNVFGNMIDMKIIDPHDVVASSLVHAASVASNILLIGCAISITQQEGRESLGLLEEI
jgi:chaperonin GroEL